MARIGIDTGGTFTDLVLLEDSGRTFQLKVPSTPDDPARALVEGVRQILAAQSLAAQPVAVQRSTLRSISHGTTVATNAMLEERFHSLALLTTFGFRHVLEIARQSVPDGYGNSYFWVKPPAIVPLERVFEITERLDHRGEVLVPLDEEGARRTARELRVLGVHSVGICLLHSYANPAHEMRLREIVLEEHPEAVVSISVEVWPEYREYERTVTTLVDAFVKPHVTGYIERAARALETVAPGSPLLIMKSNGGVLPAAAVARHPITTALSGPAAGALGASWLAGQAGYDRVITLDAGGTSTDVCLVEGAEPRLTKEGRIGRFPVRVPMIDIVSVGTGGGSIAWIGPDGGLRVGPRSAGAAPGPMAYGRGGQEPTLTDANLVLGRLPASLVGGGIQLDAEAARQGVAALAGRLRLSVERTAEGIVELAAHDQANAVVQLTVQRGIDPSGDALVAFGGSGPLQAGRLARLLGLRTILVPPHPGNVSAFGLLAVDLRDDYVMTRVQRHDDLDSAVVSDIFSRLDRAALDSLAAQGVEPARTVLVRAVEARYLGEGYEVQVPVGRVFDLAASLRAFHDAHRKAYGYAYPEGEVIEFVNWKVTGIGTIERPHLVPPESSGSGRPRGSRAGYTLYERSDLPAGFSVSGPAIVEEYGSTLVVEPDFTLTVDEFANCVLRDER